MKCTLQKKILTDANTPIKYLRAQKQGADLESLTLSIINYTFHQHSVEYRLMHFRHTSIMIPDPKNELAKLVKSR